MYQNSSLEKLSKTPEDDKESELNSKVNSVIGDAQVQAYIDNSLNMTDKQKQDKANQDPVDDLNKSDKAMLHQDQPVFNLMNSEK